MIKHIEHLRKQHPHVRTRFSLLAATTVTGLIAIVWLTTLPVRFGSPAVSSNPQTNSTASALTAANSAQNTTATPDDGKTVEEIDAENTSGLQVVDNPTGTKSTGTTGDVKASQTADYNY